MRRFVDIDTEDNLIGRVEEWRRRYSNDTTYEGDQTRTMEKIELSGRSECGAVRLDVTFDTLKDPEPVFNVCSKIVWRNEQYILEIFPNNRSSLVVEYRIMDEREFGDKRVKHLFEQLERPR